MSLWQKILTQPNLEPQFKNYYDQLHQAEIRHFFAQWIEDKFMAERVSTVADETYATNFQNEIKIKLRTYASTSDDQMKYKLSDIYTKISNIPPREFYDHLRSGIAHELQATSTLHARNPVANNSLFNPVSLQQLYHEINGGVDGCQQIRVNLDEMKNHIEIINSNVKEFHLTCERLHILYHDFQLSANTGQQQTPQHQAEGAEIQKGYESVRQQKAHLSAALHKTILKFDELKKLTIDGELKKWQHNQAQSGNGAPFKDNLDHIQYCIELLIEISCNIANFLGLIHSCIMKCSSLNYLDLGNVADLTEMRHAIEKHKRDIIISAFIVEKQPPQVMKTNTRFAATVRWLIGNQLGICATPPQVECIILSESQAKRYYSHRQMGDPRPGSSGEILNNNGTMEYNSQSRHFSVHFRNMQLKKIKRTEKKGTESVMDEKFALLFYTNLDVHNGNDFHNGTSYKIAAWTLSLPVVVIVHGNQEPQSWATITWDNAFSDINREPFEVPDQVPWSMLAMALNTKFASATQRALTEDNISFLFEKIFRGDINNDFKEVTWSLFCKEPLPDQQFTFWEWFFAIMKLTKDQILKPWCAGTIIGFINKTKAKEILRECPAGTFILRFSDSELGAISIGFVNEDSTVYNLQPWTARDLNVLSLPDRIRDITNLKYLYPNVDKDSAFGEFYSTRDEERITTGDGYVKTSITSTIPSLNPFGQNRTPNHMTQSPNPQLDINTSPMIYNPIYQDFQGATDFPDLEFSNLN